MIKEDKAQIFLSVLGKEDQANLCRVAADHATNKNLLYSISTRTRNTAAYIGIYNARSKDELVFDEYQDVHVFVVRGAFEVQDRLLETSDGLLLNGIRSLAFEALSQNAILMLTRQRSG